MNTKRATKALRELKEIACDLGVSGVSSEVLDHPKFFTWSGSSRKEQHHYGDHGLCIHTHEVVKSCLLMADMYTHKCINKEKLFLAALFHDIGKVYDYDKVNGEWCATLHKRRIHHLPRSAIYWNQHAHGMFSSYFIEDVTHCILSHHGQKEWGSPIRPQIIPAWILHCCDSMSARVEELEI